MQWKLHIPEVGDVQADATTLERLRDRLDQADQDSYLYRRPRDLARWEMVT